MERLNRKSAPQAKQYTEKVIQFGEGNFLRAFIEWIIWKTNQKTDFNGSVVVVQPIDRGMVDMLNEQDCLYHLNLQGRFQQHLSESHNNPAQRCHHHTTSDSSKS